MLAHVTQFPTKPGAPPKTENAPAITDKRSSEAFKLSLNVPEMGFV